MKILIWKSYGNIEVYRSETQEDFRGLLDLIKTIATQEDIWNSELEKCFINIDFVGLKNKPHYIENDIISYIIGCNCDSFEDIYFSDLIIL